MDVHSKAAKKQAKKEKVSSLIKTLYKKNVKEVYHITHLRDSVHNIKLGSSGIIVDEATLHSAASIPKRIGIVGGGIAGLYTALYLQHLNEKMKPGEEKYTYHIYEANSRVGGRVYTYRFNDEPNQYFEAGAMRLPNVASQQLVFDLVAYLNSRLTSTTSGKQAITLVDYVLSEENNFVKVNDAPRVTLAEYKADPSLLGFGFSVTAGTLLNSAIHPFTETLEEAEKVGEEEFEKVFKMIYDDYDQMSMRQYLSTVSKYSTEEINYIEVMTTQTNQLNLSFLDNLMMNIDFSQQTWKTIADGMDNLPNSMLSLLGASNVTLNAHVKEVTKDFIIKYEQNGKQAKSEPLDAVVFALPPGALRMIQTPNFGPVKEAAIRSLNFEPLYKMGMRFKTRFWEKVAQPSFGGQSITDLPSRWVVYPSYGLHTEGPGTLLLYAWNSDAQAFVRLTEEQRIEVALRDLQTLYPEIPIKDQFLEAKSVCWVEEWSLGDALFLPGQFKSFWELARANVGSFYFAGEHLSPYHTWIMGAVDSALHVISQLTGTEHPPPLGTLF